MQINGFLSKEQIYGKSFGEETKLNMIASLNARIFPTKRKSISNT